MTQEGVKKVLARLLTDAEFADKFIKNPQEVIKSERISVTAEELKVLSNVKKADIRGYLKAKGPIKALKEANYSEFWAIVNK